jgi:hypothetical protein
MFTSQPEDWPSIMQHKIHFNAKKFKCITATSFVRGIGRFIHLNLIRKELQAQVPLGIVARCLDLECQNFLFSGRF